MSLIGSISNIPSALLQRLPGAGQSTGPAATPAIHLPAGASPAAPADFGGMIDQLVGMVENKQAQAQAVTKSVLTGDNTQLHQSVIAMQEAGVAFQLMVEVRNKLVESYQELMRMQA